MEASERLEQGLGEIIAAVRAGQQSSAQTKHLIHTCHALASAFIRSKLGSGAFTTERFGLEVHDIAVDCIGEMFARGEQGQLTELVAYFLESEGMTDAELLSLLRRLVFSKVNNGIFRLYKDTDPGLARIIRNIKLSISKSNSLVEIERFGEACLAPADVPLLLHLRMMEKETFSQMLGGRVSGEEHVPEFISIVGRCLSEQNEYARAIPIVTLALVRRSLYSRPEPNETGRNDGEVSLNREDLRNIISHLCDKFKIENHKWYVVHRKTPPHVYDAYWLAIQHNLINRLVEEDGSDASISKLFHRFAPDVPSEEYNKVHRSRLEYLAAKVISKLIEFTKDT